MSIQKIAVLGGGSWATALVKILQENLDEIGWYIRDKERIKYILENRRNPQYLSSVELDLNRLRMSDNIEHIVNEYDIIILAIPAAFLKSSMSAVKFPLKGKKIVSAIKGIIPEENLIVGEFFNKVYSVPLESVAVISGPCHAEEVAMERLSYLTFASIDPDFTRDIGECFNCHYIKPVLSDDIYGTEYAAVLKNIMAIAAGIYHGLGYGDNFQAVLISNAIQEIKRFVDDVHPINRDIKSSAYLGDLLVTAYSQFSRNRLFGTMVGKGYSVKTAQVEMNMIAEGYFASKCIYETNKKYKVKMPIAEAVYRVLYEKISPVIEMQILTNQLK
jgi:glycerol-3-phosphate dehydrogenase (NAD(P)+)